MGQPAAKQGDQIMGTDTHIVMVPAPPGPPVPTPLAHSFTGIVNDNLSNNVNIMGMPAATVGSTAENVPPHVPMPPGVSFQTPPSNQATIRAGSSTVNINGKMAARHGDVAETCNDPVDLLVGQVVAVGTVSIG